MRKGNNLCSIMLFKVLLFTMNCILIMLGGCQKKEESTFSLRKIQFQSIPGWQNDSLKDFIPVFKESCESAVEEKENYSHLAYFQQKELVKVCKIFLTSKPYTTKSFKKFLQDQFEPHKVISPDKGLFTGYYIPILQGSLTKTDKFNIPVYSRPNDLVMVPDLSKFIPDEPFIKKRIAGKVVNGTLVPYHTREEIENGALANQNLEIMWLNDTIELFFLQIQGSGLVELTDGTKLTLGYDGTNGHRYTPIGRHLVEIGEMIKEEVSMQSIKQWLYRNPTKITAVLNQNKSYVFSKVIENIDVYGSQKSKLFPNRSIAIDLKYIPLGIPVWIDTTNPLKQNKPMRFLTMTQDTGGSIKGPVRADIFCGYGKEAGELAGKLKEAGTYYLLLPKQLKVKT
jgi:membrane-bound lytic murein transglycosylase A